MAGSQVAPLPIDASQPEVIDRINKILAVLNGDIPHPLNMAGDGTITGDLTLSGSINLSQLDLSQHYDSTWTDFTGSPPYQNFDWDTACTFKPKIAQLWFKATLSPDSNERQVYGIYNFDAANKRGGRIRFDVGQSRVRIYFGDSLTPDGAETEGYLRFLAWA